MKLVFKRKSGDPRKNDYYDVAVLVEPIGELPKYQLSALFGIKDGVVREMNEKPVKGLTYTTYNADTSVRYEMAAVDWILSQVGKSHGAVKFWDTWEFIKTPDQVQQARKAKGVWTAAEFAFVAMWKGKIKLFNNLLPYQMTPEILTNSSRIGMRSKLVAS